MHKGVAGIGRKKIQIWTGGWVGSGGIGVDTWSLKQAQV